MPRSPGRGCAAALAAGLLLSAACCAAQSVFQVVNSTAETQLLAAGLQAAGVAQTLSDPSLRVTFFAPSSQALLSALTQLGMTTEELLAMGPSLAPIFQYHVLTSPVPSASLAAGSTVALPTLTGANLTVSKDVDGAIAVQALGSDATVEQADLSASDSVVHIIDQVLFPFFPTIAAAAVRTPQLSTLAAAVASAGLASTLANASLTATVFAPTNDAFTATLNALGVAVAGVASTPSLLSGVLSYHVVPQRLPASSFTAGGATYDTLLPDRQLQVAVNGSGNVVVTPVGAYVATVIVADVPIGVGPRSVVHIVDTVLLPFYSSVANAAQRNQLNTLLAAVAAEGSYAAAVNDPRWRGTVLAPTDAAFAALLARLGVSAAQLLSNTATLKAVLELHIIPNAALLVANVSDGASVATVFGQLTARKTSSGELSFVAAQSTATVAVANLVVNPVGLGFPPGNAVVHIVDTVLLPAGLALPPASPAGGGAPAPNSGSGAAGMLPAVSPALMAVCSVLGMLLLRVFGAAVL